MFHLRLVGLLFFVLLQVAFSSSHNAIPFQQVPVCAPVPGSNTQGVHQGPKGEQGVPGKRGAKGEAGGRGLRGEAGRIGERGVKGAKGERGDLRHPLGYEDCPSVTHHLPRDNQTTDYVQYRNYVPSMKEGTVCAWIQTTDDDVNIKIVLGYASPTGGDNELMVGFMFGGALRIFVHGSPYDFVEQTLPSLPKKHLCLTFSSTRNQRIFYMNGKLVKTVSHETNMMLGGGILVLGQDHDINTGGGFDASQCFKGSITNFMIWPRVLTGQAIHNIAFNCVCPVDFAVAMTLDRVEHHGEAYYSIPDQCPTV